jgi:hypothetical protein
VIELKVKGYKSNDGEEVTTVASFSHILKEVWVSEIREQMHQDSVLMRAFSENQY